MSEWHKVETGLYSRKVNDTDRLTVRLFDGDWYWNFFSSGRWVDSSHEGYESHEEAEEAADEYISEET